MLKERLKQRAIELVEYVSDKEVMKEKAGELVGYVANNKRRIAAVSVHTVLTIPVAAAVLAQYLLTGASVVVAAGRDTVVGLIDSNNDLS